MIRRDVFQVAGDKEWDKQNTQKQRVFRYGSLSPSTAVFFHGTAQHSCELWKYKHASPNWFRNFRLSTTVIKHFEIRYGSWW